LFFKETGAGFAMTPYFAPQITALAKLHDDPNFCGLFVDDPAEVLCQGGRCRSNCWG
jgi:hypothetical protein